MDLLYCGGWFYMEGWSIMGGWPPSARYDVFYPPILCKLAMVPHKWQQIMVQYLHLILNDIGVTYLNSVYLGSGCGTFKSPRLVTKNVKKTTTEMTGKWTCSFTFTFYVWFQLFIRHWCQFVCQPLLLGFLLSMHLLLDDVGISSLTNDILKTFLGICLCAEM